MFVLRPFQTSADHLFMSYFTNMYFLYIKLAKYSSILQDYKHYMRARYYYLIIHLIH